VVPFWVNVVGEILRQIVSLLVDYFQSSLTGSELPVNHTNGLIARFILGAMAPAAVVGFAAAVPLILGSMLQIPPHVVVVIVMIVVLITLRIRFPGSFHFWKHSSVDSEYGITPPSCTFCHYDLRATPEYCPQCGQAVGRVDGTIIRYLMSLRRRDSIDSAMQHADVNGK
jgi:hypothetical protein